MGMFTKFFRNVKLFFLFLLGLIVLSFFLTSYYTIGPDEDAVVIRLGKFLTTNAPGLHFKLPFGIDEVRKVKTKRVLQMEFGFRSSNDNDFDEESLMVTGDLNVADVQWVVQYQIADPFKYIFSNAMPENTIRDVSESIMRRVVGDRAVTEVLTTGRVEISVMARDLMQSVLDKYNMGIKIVTVKLQDVNPPREVRASFNEVNAAMQEQEKIINQAEEAYNLIIPEARGKAEQEVLGAQGYATELVNRAKGDAARFDSMLTEYRKAPAVTKKRMYIEAMEDVLSKVKDFTIVDGNLKGLLPVFTGSEKSEK